MRTRLVAVTMMLWLPAATIAGTPVAVRPVQTGLDTLRYDRGIATVDLATDSGAVQVSPLGFDHGGLMFSVAVFNAGDRPATIDVTDISVAAGSEVLRVLTADELVKKAQNRAMWTQIGIALLTGVAAGLQASQRDTYRGRYRGSNGQTYRWRYSVPSASGQIGAAVTVATGAYAISRVQDQLDRTRDGIGANALQVTTIDPGESYGGRIVLTKIRKRASGQIVRMTIHWNGKDYPLAFEVGGTGPAPLFRAAAVAATIGPRAP